MNSQSSGGTAQPPSPPIPVGSPFIAVIAAEVIRIAGGVRMPPVLYFVVSAAFLAFCIYSFVIALSAEGLFIGWNAPAFAAAMSLASIAMGLHERRRRRG